MRKKSAPKPVASDPNPTPKDSGCHDEGLWTTEKMVMEMKVADDPRPIRMASV